MEMQKTKQNFKKKKQGTKKAQKFEIRISTKKRYQKTPELYKKYQKMRYLKCQKKIFFFVIMLRISFNK